SYLCAGRAIVLSAPKENLASKIITGSEAGAAVPPDDTAGFVREIVALLESPSERTKCAANARSYAERTFDIGRIANRFETILRSVTATLSARRHVVPGVVPVSETAVKG